jgi:hypothetical protein
MELPAGEGRSAAEDMVGSWVLLRTVELADERKEK